MITFQAENIAFPPIKRNTIKRWIKEVATQYQKKVGDVHYIFCTDDRILEVNNQYLAHDYYTDIITFDYSENEVISGDLFISLDTVESNSKQFGTAYMEELHRVMIHGVLHLCGLKDSTEEEAKNMREAEDKALSLLQTPTNY